MGNRFVANDVLSVINIVNRENKTSYRLLNRFDKGECGAYRIAELGKKPVVLKFYINLRNTNIIDPDPELATKITGRLFPLGYPVPKYIHTGHIGEGLYWVQQELLGQPLWQNPTVDQVKKMLSFLSLQAKQAVSNQQNYAHIVKDTVFNNRLENVSVIRQYSQSTKAFMDKLLKKVSNLQDITIPTTDIVHGDFSYHQVMVEKNNITGIIDWQEAGCGDWKIDLTRLIYSLHDRPQLVKPLIRQVKNRDLPFIQLYTAFTAIEMLSWPIKNKQENFDYSFKKAKSAINFVFNKISNHEDRITNLETKFPVPTSV